MREEITTSGEVCLATFEVASQTLEVILLRLWEVCERSAGQDWQNIKENLGKQKQLQQQRKNGSAKLWLLVRSIAKTQKFKETDLD